MSANECNLKGGHPKAVVVGGGMRISQHKTPKSSAGINEDITGLNVASSPPKTTISGAVPKGDADFTAEAVQSIHKEKPAAIHCSKPHVNIQQPRKY